MMLMSVSWADRSAVLVSLSLALALVGGSLLIGGEPAAVLIVPPLLTHSELQVRLGRPTLRLLDYRPRESYDKGHIPGAVWVDPRAVEALAARPGALTDRDAWQSWIAPLGIGDETEVFVYDAARQRDAARLWWLLRYFGVEKAGLIDGDFGLWAAEKRPLTTDSPPVQPDSFSVRLLEGRLAT
jgi:thiosulfate/3-mercaptopyruvate sulfurtransferase